MSDESNTSASSRFEGERPPLLGLVLNADRMLRMRLDELLVDYDLPTPEYTALAILRRYGPLTTAELARRVFVTPQAMGQIVGSVERRGLIERQRDPNHGRRLIADLTPKGRDLIARCMAGTARIEDEFLRPLSAREQKFFLRMFADCILHLQGHPLPVNGGGSD